MNGRASRAKPFRAAFRHPSAFSDVELVVTRRLSTNTPNPRDHCAKGALLCLTCLLSIQQVVGILAEDTCIGTRQHAIARLSSCRHEKLNIIVVRSRTYASFVSRA